MALAVAAPYATGRTRAAIRRALADSPATSVGAIAVAQPITTGADTTDGYFVLLAGVEHGPYSAEHLRWLARNREIHPTDPVSRGGHTWQPAGQAVGVYSRKDWLTALTLSIFFGLLGLDRFYLGHIRLGLAKLALGWLTLGIWPLVDAIGIARRTIHDGQNRPLR